MFEYMLGIEITSNNLACMREIECLSIQDRTNKRQEEEDKIYVVRLFNLSLHSRSKYMRSTIKEKTYDGYIENKHPSSLISPLIFPSHIFSQAAFI